MILEPVNLALITLYTAVIPMLEICHDISRICRIYVKYPHILSVLFVLLVAVHLNSICTHFTHTQTLPTIPIYYDVLETILLTLNTQPSLLT